MANTYFNHLIFQETKTALDGSPKMVHIGLARGELRFRVLAPCEICLGAATAACGPGYRLSTVDCVASGPVVGPDGAPTIIDATRRNGVSYSKLAQALIAVCTDSFKSPYSVTRFVGQQSRLELARKRVKCLLKVEQKWL